MLLKFRTILVVSIFMLAISSCGGGGDGNSGGAGGRSSTQITGSVYDSTTGIPLKDAIVKTSPVSEEYQTGTDGRYVLNVELADAQEYRVFAEHLGYDGTDGRALLSQGEIVNVDLPLSKTVVGLVAGPTTLIISANQTTASFKLTRHSRADRVFNSYYQAMGISICPFRNYYRWYHYSYHGDGRP